MITRPVSFIAIATNVDYIYGLDSDGIIWYRENPSKSNTTTWVNGQQQQVKKDPPKTWKQLYMRGRVDVPKGESERDADKIDTETNTVTPAPKTDSSKVYADKKTITAVQTALKAKALYPERVDGEMGKCTVRAINNYRKENGLAETGTVTFELCQLLGLVPSDEESEVIPDEPEVDEITDTGVTAKDLIDSSDFSEFPGIGGFPIGV